jgi:two-component sensor histidine kinase
LLGDIRFVMGRCDHYRGDYDKALKNYFEALSYSERAGDTLRAAEANNTIGGIYYNQGDGKTAYDYYRKSLTAQLHQHNDFRSGRGYLNTGSALIAQNKLAEARTHLDSSLYYYRKINSLEGISYVYGTLPLIFIKTHQPDSALKYLLMAREATLRVNKLYALGQVNHDIARIYFEKGNTTESLKYIDEGLAFCKKTRQNFEQLSLLKLKAELFEKNGDHKTALENYKLYKAYSDSVLNAASIKKQTEEALNYDYNKRQYEQKLAAEKEELLREEKENRQRLIIYAILAIALVAAILLYFRYRTKKKAGEALQHAYKTLEQKNLVIEDNAKKLKESLAERELLLKEIHHRVKNNLQVISGLLELQKEELTEEGSKAAFDEGQSRVRSISLIHQNLYQNDELGSIMFRAFVHELVLQVKEVFEHMDRTMNVTLDMPDKVLDIDTAVPLGLIINELLTNSYKYAAVKGKSGSIHMKMEDKGDGNYLFFYSDSGPGIKNEIDFEKATTLGLRLIKGLAGQLAGRATYNKQSGSVFIIEFKDSKARREE